jgi:GTP-binding protein
MSAVSTFLKSAAAPTDFPADIGHEVAFVGRSNSGKSSAINAIVGMRNLARVSKTPGRTQLINFFDVGSQRRIVDLPGYGFARVPAAIRQQWQQLLESYLLERRSLSALLLTVDIRRGLTAMDRTLLGWIAPRELPVGLLLTKADKLSRGAGLAQERGVVRELPRTVRVARFSAVDRAGVTDARAWLDEWLARGESSGIKKPRVRDSGDTPGAPEPGGVGRGPNPAQGG